MSLSQLIRKRQIGYISHKKILASLSPILVEDDYLKTKQKYIQKNSKYNIVYNEIEYIIIKYKKYISRVYHHTLEDWCQFDKNVDENVDQSTIYLSFSQDQDPYYHLYVNITVYI